MIKQKSYLYTKEFGETKEIDLRSLIMDNVMNHLVRFIIENIDFNYSSFNEAKYTCFLNTDKTLQICFDRLSGFVYFCDFAEDDCNCINNQIFTEYSLYCQGDRKHRNYPMIRYEYSVLLNYCLIHPELLDWAIQKKERPDFVLANQDRKIGIEVTQFTLDVSSIVAKISRKFFGQNKRIDEIKEYASEHHKSYEGKLNFYEEDGVNAISIPIVDTIEVKHGYADQIIKKYEKYCDQMNHYHEFIVLCDARSAMCVKNKEDIEEIVGMTKEKCKEITGFTLCVLLLDENDECFCVTSKY